VVRAPCWVLNASPAVISLHKQVIPLSSSALLDLDLYTSIIHGLFLGGSFTRAIMPLSSVKQAQSELDVTAPVCA
jgi:hypothetical protein